MKRKFTTPDGECDIQIDAPDEASMLKAIKHMEDSGLELGPPIKREYLTHRSEFVPIEEQWCAVEKNRAFKLLEGYNLTHEEMTDLPALMAGYCRLLDDAGLIGYGRTKKEAIWEAL